MKRQAKAPSTGSTTRPGKRLALAAAFCAALCLALGVTLAAAVAPVVTVEDATNVQYSTADVEGHVNPEGQSTEWRFQYATEADFSNAQDGPSGTTETEEDISGQLTNLTPGTTYHLRLLAQNGDGQSEAVAAGTFETKVMTTKPLAEMYETTGVTSSTAHISGFVNPNAPGGTDDPAFNTKWKFQCNRPGPDNCALPGFATILADADDHLVEADLSNLDPNTYYFPRLVVQNIGGTVIRWGEPFKTLPVLPEAKPGNNTPESDSEATIRGFIDSHNSRITECRFEYGQTTTYGTTLPCDSVPPPSNVFQAVSASISDLEPDTTYHFRLLTATEGTEPGSAGTQDGHAQSTDATFRTFQLPSPSSECQNSDMPGGGELPDCRAWEMVSPGNKNGGDILVETTQTRPATDGDAVGFASLKPFADTAGAPLAADYVGQRFATPGTQGWGVHSISPSVTPISASGIKAELISRYLGDFSSDLSSGIYTTPTNLSGDPIYKNVPNYYLRTDLLSPGAGNYQLLSRCDDCATPLPSFSGPLRSGLTIVNATPDFGHVSFQSRQQLTADAPPCADTTNPLLCPPKLYEWDHGVVRLVGVLPDGSPAPMSLAGKGPVGTLHYTERTISDDGSRLIFTVPTDPEGAVEAVAEGELFERVDHTTTLHINGSERTDCAGDPSCGGDDVPDPAPDPNATGNAEFLTASTDGTQVFFASRDALTDEGSSELYRYDGTLPESDPHNLTRIAGDEVGEFAGVLGASDAGDYLYFVAQSPLAIGDAANGFSGLGVFMWHDGDVHFIGSVAQVDADPLNLGMSALIVPNTARVSSDGRHLAFVASMGIGLTGYDHGSTCGLGASPCREVYLFDADDDSVVCASCGRAGRTATTDAGFTLVPDVGVGGVSTHRNHALSADGTRVFFTSGEALSPEDHNGRRDVYMYDAATGEQELISTGSDIDDSFFLDATPNGSDVFFATHERLVGWDTDNAIDLYDARIEGGFPEPAPPRTPCVDDTCQGPARNAPGPTDPLTPGTLGPGDPDPAAKRKQCRKQPKRCRRHKHHKRRQKHPHALATRTRG